MTTDPEILHEWDYSRNKTDPSKVSRNLLYYAWWKCNRGHSWRDKIVDHVIGKSVCYYCESEFQRMVPQMLISLYAKRYGLSVAFNDESAIGFQLDVFIPDISLAFSFLSTNSKKEHDIQFVVEQLCKDNNIQICRIPSKVSFTSLNEIVKKAFAQNHIYINSNADDDLKTIWSLYLKTNKFEQTH